MTSKQDESYECQSDTESMISSEFDELNRARIHDTPLSSFLTPSKKKKMPTKKKNNDSSSDDEQDWGSQITRTIYNGSTKRQALQKQTKLNKKYPKQVKNTKFGTVTVNIKNKTSAKYQNVCSICLDSYSNVRGVLKCGHKFCAECIQQWIKTSTNCPCCRAKFVDFVKVTINDKKIEQKRQIIQVKQRDMEFNELDYFVCYHCDRGDDQDVLLICDMCDFYCCHVYCDSTLGNVFPTHDWFCRSCKETLHNSQVENRRVSNIIRTQTSVNNHRPMSQTTRTLSLVQNSQAIQSDAESEQSVQASRNFVSIKRTGAANGAQIGVSTRSKAFEILNGFGQNHPSHINPARNRLPSVFNRITNSTAMNLRNLRRRRVN